MGWFTRGVCATGLAALLSFSASSLDSPVSSPSPTASPRSVTNSRLHRLQEHLSHLPQVYRTHLCETPGAQLGIVQVRQVHHDAWFMEDLRPVLFGADQELAQHALAVMQDQYLYLGMIQEDIYGILQSVREKFGLRAFHAEGASTELSASEAAYLYADRVSQLIDDGLFLPDPTDMPVFPLDATQARVDAQLEVVRYLVQFLANAPRPLSPPAFAPQSDFSLVQFAPGADVRFAADYGVRLLPMEDAAAYDRIMSKPTWDWPAILEGREKYFLNLAWERREQSDIALTVFGAGHAFGGTRSCPDAPEDLFADRIIVDNTFPDTLDELRRAGYAISVLEVEPSIYRHMREQTQYNGYVARALKIEAAIRQGREPEPMR